MQNFMNEHICMIRKEKLNYIITKLFNKKKSRIKKNTCHNITTNKTINENKE